MEALKTCYVSIPFGIKDGIDFEWIYHEVVRPAAADAGLACQRGDELSGVALLQKAILQSVIACDVMIADVSNNNPNVMYELGVRHALRRAVTILLSSGPPMLPFHMRNCPLLRYGAPEDIGSPSQVLAMRERITAAIQSQASRVATDSPIFEYFRDLRVQLPDELTAGELRYIYPSASKRRSRGRGEKKEDAALAEAATRTTANVDPRAYIEVLNQYRDLSAWDDVIRLAQALPPDVVNSPQVVQTLALAFTRRGQPEQAIDALRQYTEQTGGDAETDGLLGSLYKKRYFADRRRSDLNQSIAHYRHGFERDRQNLSLGRTLAMMLQRNGDDSAAELAALLPKVRALAAAKIDDSSVPDYFDLECRLVLDVIARDWPSAQATLDRILAMRPESWLLDSSRVELESMADAGFTSKEQVQLHELLDRIARLAVAEENGDA